jgi:putative flippase GtrA
LKILKNRELQSQIVRYIVISLFGYSFVFISLYALVDMLKFNKSIAFMIVYGISYLMLYTLQLRVLFKTTHSSRKLFKFCLSLVFFYVLANILFNTFNFFEINYLISTFITVLILTPVRFFISKFYVYQ